MIQKFIKMKYSLYIPSHHYHIHNNSLNILEQLVAHEPP